LVVANLSRFAQHLTLELGEHAGKAPVDVFSRSPFPPIGHAPYPLMLGPHGFVWLSLENPSGPRRSAAQAGYEPPVISLDSRWEELLFGAERVQLEEILPTFLARQHWFHGEGKTPLGCTIQSIVDIAPDSEEDALYLMTVRIDYNAGDPEIYVMPLDVDQDQGSSQLDNTCPPIVRLQYASGRTATGTLRDAAYDPRFVKALLRLVLPVGPAAARLASIEVLRTPVMDVLRDLDIATADVRPASMQQDNSVAMVDERAVVKLFRRAQEGINPDLELTLHLTALGYPHAPHVAAALQQSGAYREDVTLAVISSFVAHNGTAWAQALSEFEAYFGRLGPTAKKLTRHSNSPRAIAEGVRRPIPSMAQVLIGPYLDDVALLGRRTAELHAALAAAPDHPSLAPEHFTEFYQRSLYQRFRASTIRTLARLEAEHSTWPESTSGRINELAAHRDDILARFEVLHRRHFEALRIRCHGNLHLEDVLRVNDDFMFVDFEGEPTLPLYERRLKAAPLTDAVSLVRSIFYVPQGHLLSHAMGDHPEDRPPWLETAVRFWQYWVSVALLKAYRATAKKARMLPPSQDFDHLLDVLFTARTVHELAYEQAHRPEWLSIPLDDLLEMVRDQE
jgi:maltose alpha-D-glucosyltransferase / alpha-amylase